MIDINSIKSVNIYRKRSNNRSHIFFLNIDGVDGFVYSINVNYSSTNFFSLKDSPFPRQNIFVKTIISMDEQNPINSLKRLHKAILLK